MSCKNLLITIKSIRGIADDLGYVVGTDGVTDIITESYSTDPYCYRLFYLIRKGKALHSRVSDQAVAEIVYFPPEEQP